jgi:hypothetical protein
MCSAKPMYYADAGSLNPNDTPITAKNVPARVPDIISTITRRPEIAHVLIKPASEQDSMNCFLLALTFIFVNLSILIAYEHTI